MKAHRVALALEHRAPKVVVEDDARHRLEEAKRLDVTTQEARHRGAKREAHEAIAAVREHHHEGPQIPHRASHGELAEVRAVHLRLLPREHRAAQLRLGVPTRAEPADDRAKRALRARIATLLHHRPEAARAEAWILRERLVDEGRYGSTRRARAAGFVMGNPLCASTRSTVS